MSATRTALLVSFLIALPAPSLHAADTKHGQPAAGARHAQPSGTAQQAELDILRDTLRANKRAFVAVNLKLTDEEAGRFWPLYDRYEGEQRAINDRFVKLLDEYSNSFPNLSDDRASALITDYLAAETDRAQLRQKYLPEFSKALPGRKVARFYQLENKIEAVLRYDLAAHVPVVEQ
ncbi:MAG: hypothetical protein E6J72_08745 [Deltaproteobacteria bacterium]|nr:MAG: hypothetical protein E6J72_08745 [Deltaproteobacteria bacterium]